MREKFSGQKLKGLKQKSTAPTSKRTLTSKLEFLDYNTLHLYTMGASGV
jgi:hypothetical protein